MFLAQGILSDFNASASPFFWQALPLSPITPRAPVTGGVVALN